MQDLRTTMSLQSHNPLERGLTAVEQASERATRTLAEQAGDAAAEVQRLGSRAGDEAARLARQTVGEAARLSRQTLDGATRLSRQTAGYVQQQPVKAALISAAVGIVAVGLVALLSGRGSR